MADPADLIWIQDAVREYSRSRVWLDSQIDQGILSVVRIPGDKRAYLLRSELDRLLRPRIQRPGNLPPAEGGTGENVG